MLRRINSAPALPQAGRPGPREGDKGNAYGRRGPGEACISRAAIRTDAGPSAETAIRFEKAFGVKADTLMQMQMAQELAGARAREGEIVVEAA
jgi:hypothetical protein